MNDHESKKGTIQGKIEKYMILPKHIVDEFCSEKNYYPKI